MDVTFHCRLIPEAAHRFGTKHSGQSGDVVIRGVPGVIVSRCATFRCLTSRFTPTCLFSLQLVPGVPQPGRRRQRSLGEENTKVRWFLMCQVSEVLV